MLINGKKTTDLKADNFSLLVELKIAYSIHTSEIVEDLDDIISQLEEVIRTWKENLFLSREFHDLINLYNSLQSRVECAVLGHDKTVIETKKNELKERISEVSIEMTKQEIDNCTRIIKLADDKQQIDKVICQSTKNSSIYVYNLTEKSTESSGCEFIFHSSPQIDESFLDKHIEELGNSGTIPKARLIRTKNDDKETTQEDSGDNINSVKKK